MSFVLTTNFKLHKPLWTWLLNFSRSKIHQKMAFAWMERKNSLRMASFLAFQEEIVASACQKVDHTQSMKTPKFAKPVTSNVQFFQHFTKKKLLANDSNDLEEITAKTLSLKDVAQLAMFRNLFHLYSLLLMKNFASVSHHLIRWFFMKVFQRKTKHHHHRHLNIINFFQLI